jgi:hypothetical protein
MWFQFRFSLALAAALIAVASGSEATAPVGGSWCGNAQNRRNLRTLDDAAHARLADLVARSVTVREMVALLCAERDVHFTLRGSRHLKREHRSGGRSGFAVVDGVLIGRLEFDTGESAREAQQIVVAHELAHGVELARLPRLDTRTLAQRLLAHTGRHVAWWPHRTIETPFALAVEKQVAGELRLDLTPTRGRLEELARRHHLSPLDASAEGQR